jgi:mannonate dehydratase
MDLTVMLPPRPDRRWTIAQQLGIDTAVVRFWGEEEWWTYDSLLHARTRFEDHGLSLDIVEDRPPMERTVLSIGGRSSESPAATRR